MSIAETTRRPNSPKLRQAPANRLASLPAPQREAIEAFVKYGSHIAAANALGVKIGTLKSRIHRGRQHLDDSE